MIRIVPWLTIALLALPASACPQPQGADQMAEIALTQINSYRSVRGLQPVLDDSRLRTAAQSHACDSAARGHLGHRGTDGSSLADRAARAGYAYRRIAENVAQGHPDPHSAVRGWIDSPGHRRNLQMAQVQDAGIGIARDARGDLHWVLMLGHD